MCLKVGREVGGWSWSKERCQAPGCTKRQTPVFLKLCPLICGSDMFLEGRSAI